MATLEEFMRTGHLGPVILGMSSNDAMTALGDPDDISRKSNPLILKYGPVQLSFWKTPPKKAPQLREIAIAFQPEFERLPKSLSITDWNPTEPPTEGEFRSFIDRIEYPPAQLVEGPTDKALTFLSGVTALVSDGKLHSLRLKLKENKTPPPTPVTVEREATLDQIQGMLIEAEHALMIGAHRAALLIGWAGLEAALRRVAYQEGRQGKVGIPLHILLRELFASGRLSPDEHRWLETLRQIRTAAAHGLAPIGLDSDMVERLIEETHRLLSSVELRA